VKKVAFRVFRSQGFGDLQIEPTATDVAEFASSLRADQLVNITHSLDGHNVCIHSTLSVA
jgi:hypothetical protein